MARRKSDAEVGPIGVWAYDSRIALDMKVEGVVARLPGQTNPATLRKIEGGSGKPSPRLWGELAKLYRRVADEKGVTLEPQPRLRPDNVPADQDGDTGALVGAVRELVDEIRADRADRQAARAERLEWEHGLLE